MTLPDTPFVCKGINLEAAADRLESAEKAWWEDKVTEFSMLRPNREWYLDTAREGIAAALGEIIPAEVKWRCDEVGECREGDHDQQRFVTAWQPVVSDTE